MCSNPSDRSHPQSSGLEVVTHVIHERAAPDVDVLAVKRVLQEADNVLALCVLGCKALGPRQELAGVKSGLLDGEAGGQ